MRDSELQFLIVNYRTPALTIRCINSITALGIPESNILVVDNCSGDDSVASISAAAPKTKLIPSAHNRGFGAGVNLGMGHAAAKYVLVLNPDTIFIEDFTRTLISFLDNDESIAIVGLNLLNPDGSAQYSARRFYSFADIALRRSGVGEIWPLSRLNDRHLMKAELAAGQVFDADWVMGTGFVARKSIFEQLNGMDEGYFLYMEDVDLCARVWQAGLRVVCMPAASIIHDHQRASARSPFSTASKAHLASLRRFAGKFRVPFLYARNRAQVLRLDAERRSA